MKNLLLLIGFLSIQLNAQNSCQPPVYYFNNMSVVSGTGGVGSVYKFTSVLSGIDAFVTVTKVQNASVTNSSMDNGGGYQLAWQPFITFPSARTNASDSSYIEFKLEFKSDASPFNLVKQNCMAMGIVDCDGTGNSNSYREMLKVSKPGTPMGVQNSTLTVFEDTKWILFKSGSAQFNNIDTVNSAAMGQMNFPKDLTTIYLRIGAVGPVTANTTRQFSMYFKSFAALSIPLPVHLADFKANVVNNAIQLNWLSTQETNFSNFEIYRSDNGKDFTYLASVAGKGNSNELNTYSFLDFEGFNLSKRVFYKLRLIDRNGAAIWSHIVVNDAVNLDDMNDFKVFPNPVNSVINLKITDIAPIQSVQVTDVYGKVILSGNTDNFIAGVLSVDVAMLEKGVYLFHLYREDGSIDTVKFIKN